MQKAPQAINTPISYILWIINLICYIYNLYFVELSRDKIIPLINFRRFKKTLYYISKLLCGIINTKKS